MNHKDNNTEKILIPNIDFKILFKILRRQFKVFISVFIIILSISILYICITKNTYISSIALVNTYYDDGRYRKVITCTEVKDFVANYITSFNYLKKHNKLPKELSKVKELSFSYERNEKEEENNLIEVYIYVSDTNKIKLIENKIIDYINNSEFVKNQINIEKKILESYKTRTEEQLKNINNDLSDYKKGKNNLKEFKSVPYDIFYSTEKLQERKLEIEVQSEHLNNSVVDVLYSTSPRLVGLTKINHLILLGIFGIILSSFIAILKDKLTRNINENPV